ncbi:N-acetylglucosamine-6-phosphate deacetylase [Serinibacter arcticus]|uniref:N-acetylglucosamine-6-phosphate deacetylase n=2 Tax=Serinibacter arcticus TaxID=1655435 RepID=A0A2U2A028_9MICO|nr:N-acetylglucosamine-6-phosphate deacetylase [Serinibacter arcticus]
MVDLQVNGFAGHDVNGDDPRGAVHEITAALARIGVTSWVPTVITAPEERIVAAVRAVATAREESPEVAAAVPFVHVEGPFLSVQDGARGVHDPAHVRDLDADEVARWCAAGPVGIVTVSPHTPDAAAHVARVVALGVQVAIGHTHATPAQVRDAVRAGANLSTHLGNGVATTLPRHPNVLWAQLAEDALTCGLIADGHHLPADTLQAMLRAKGPGRAFLVSDATALAGLPPGRYATPVGGEVELTAEGRLSPVGSDLLAGAARSLADGLRHVLAETSTTLAEAVDLVSFVPARIARLALPLAIGSPADLLLLGPDGSVHEVRRGGRLIP